MGAADGLRNHRCSLTVCRGASGCCPTQSSLSLSLSLPRPVRPSVRPRVCPSIRACRNPPPVTPCRPLRAFSLFLLAAAPLSLSQTLDPSRVPFGRASPPPPPLFFFLAIPRVGAVLQTPTDVDIVQFRCHVSRTLFLSQLGAI